MNTYIYLVHIYLQHGDLLPIGQQTLHSQQLVISSVSREDVGLYTCTASNGVGTPASASINLQVLCKLHIQYHVLISWKISCRNHATIRT